MRLITKHLSAILTTLLVKRRKKEKKGTIVNFFRNPPLRKADKTPPEPIITVGEQQEELTREVEVNNLVP